VTDRFPTPDKRFALEMLLEEYARLLDDDRLEDWVELFDEACVYEIVSRENREQDLPLSLMLCDNKDMLADRISSLRQANIYNIHTDRHILSLPRCTAANTGDYEICCAYALYQSNQEGRSWLFSVGRYEHRVVEKNGRLLFRHALVVVDTGAVPTLLAVPI
jgi:anthranilate 1,2-dioxygenase small subunit